MKNTMSKAVWGVIFVLLGVTLAGRAFGVFDFNIFFPGWWTLFIIVPSAIGLVNSENRTASIFGLGVGILLLIVVQGFVDWYTFPRLIIALIFVVIGCSFLFRTERRNGHGEDNHSNYNTYNKDSSNNGNNGASYSNNHDNSSQSSSSQSNSSQSSNGQNNDSQSSNSQNNSGSNYSYSSSYNNNDKNNNYNSNNSNSNFNNYNYQGTNHAGYNHYSGFLSGRNIQFVDEEFTGAVVTSILGNVQLDLRNAILNDDVVVETTCILGGVDVYIPNNAKVVINCTPILGGIECKVVTPYNAASNMHTIFIKGTCILGGIEVK